MAASSPWLSRACFPKGDSTIVGNCALPLKLIYFHPNVCPVLRLLLYWLGGGDGGGGHGCEKERERRRFGGKCVVYS